MQTLLLGSKDAETLIAWHAALQLVVLEHQAARPKLTPHLASWLREVFDSIDRKSRGFIPVSALSKLLAATNSSVHTPTLPPDLQRLSLAHVQWVVVDLLTAVGTPIRDLFDKYSTDGEMQLDDWLRFCRVEQQDEDEESATASFDKVLTDTTPPKLSRFDLHAVGPLSASLPSSLLPDDAPAAGQSTAAAERRVHSLSQRWSRLRHRVAGGRGT